MQRFQRMRSLQKFAAVHAAVPNHVNQKRARSSRQNFKLSRAAALIEWRDPCGEKGTHPVRAETGSYWSASTASKSLHVERDRAR
jgi:hypothetical protein